MVVKCCVRWGEVECEIDNTYVCICTVSHSNQHSHVSDAQAAVSYDNYTALATAAITCCCMYFIYEGRSVNAEFLSDLKSEVVCSIRYKAQWAGAPDTRNMPNY